MKNITFLIAILITFLQLNAQNTYSKNKTLEIDYYNYKAADFGVSNSKNLIEINEKKYVLPFEDDKGLALEVTKNFRLKKGKIIFRHYKGKYYESSSNYMYNKNYKTLEKRVYLAKDGNEAVSFKFDKKGRMIEITTTFKKAGTKSVKHVVYNDSNNTIERYTLGDEGKKYNHIQFKTNDNGLIISKTTKSTKLSPNEENRFYTYKDKKISRISKNKTLDGVIQKSSEASSEYNYNDKGLIVKDKGDLTISDFNFNHNHRYEYVYDKNGNWIVKYKFRQKHGYDDLESEGYKGISSVTMRKLTYKNGTISGATNITSSTVQNYLNEVVSNNPFKTKKAPKKGVFWFRNSERAVKLYHDGDYIGRQSNLLIILKNDFYANDSINNTMYKLKDFKLKPMQDAFYKADVFASNDEVVWFRSSEKAIKSYKNGTPLVGKLNYFKIYDKQFFINDSTTNSFYKLKDFGLEEIQGKFQKAIKIGDHNDVLWIKLENGNFTIVKNGKNITNSIKMVYAKNGNNVLIKENGIPKYAMINAKNTSINDFNKAMPYNEYLKLEPDQGVKETIPQGFLWKKNENEQFYIYKNGKVDPSKLNVVGFYQHQFVYDVDHDISYVLEDFDTKEINKYFTINVLKGNIFYYKTTENKIGIFKNGKAIDFNNSKYMENGIDVKSFDLNEVDAYILKDYKNLKNMILGEVISVKK